MNGDYWKARWKQKQIGFHEGKPNALLVKHWPSLALDAATAFVPLCGKAEDLAWLRARGHRVIGVELVESAVREFFSEHGLTPNIEPRGELTAFEAEGLTIFVGDFFALTREHLGGATMLYDRAALIALPSPLRERYVKRLHELMPPGTRALIITASYDQSKMDGPPHSVPPDEVRQHYPKATVTQLDDVPAEGGKLVTVGAREIALCVEL